MFTGIIEEISKIIYLRKQRGLTVDTEIVYKNSSLGDSISVNGACLTITGIKNKALTFDTMQETLSKTNLKYLKTGDFVNLERSLKPESRLGGHFVYGHIDGIRRIVELSPKGSKESYIDIQLEIGDRKYLVEKGSVAIEGISLTIGKIFSDKLRVYLIPHTLENTTLKYEKKGNYVNVEFDILGKYILNKTNAPTLTKDFLTQAGF